MDDIWAISPYVLECKGNDPFLDEWEELGQMQSADGDEFSFQDFSVDATIMAVSYTQRGLFSRSFCLYQSVTLLS